MTKRRSARLLEKEEKVKKANLSSVGPVGQDSAVFDPKHREVLSQIINNLDPRSFVRLARTCKEMNHFCFSNKDIKVRCWIRTMKEYRCLEMSDYRGRFSYSLTLKKENGGEFLYDSSFLKKLSSMPFVYTLRKLVIHSTVTDRLLTTLRTWLTRNFPWVRIREIEMFRLENCWEEMAQFVQEAEVVKLSSWLRNTEASRDVLSYLTKTLTHFSYDHRVDGDIILEAKAKQLCLYGAKISKETFKELVKKFIAGEIFDWIIGSDDERDPFIEAVSEVVKTVTVVDIVRSTMERSVLYKIHDYGIFYFRRPDGEMTSFTVQPDLIEFERI